MKHLGDITKLNGYELPIVDIITGGSPCQDLSVAGKRAGLAGERSGLFMEQIRIIKEMRENDRIQNQRTDKFIRPRYMVWENVPGAFSSNKGEDFRAVLEEICKIKDEDAVIPRPKDGKWTPSGCIMGDGWSVAWRVHDAQFWGVPQRRKRIALVADFAGGAAPEILFEPKSLYGNPTQSREEGQGTTEDVERSVGETSAVVQGADMYNGSLTGEVAATLNATSGDSPTHSGPSVVCLENHPSDSRVKIREDGMVQTLSSRMGTGGGNVPMVMKSSDGDIAGTLDANYYKGCGERQGVEQTVVAYANDAYDKWSKSEKGASLRASGGVYGGGSESLSVGSVVRRLTPLECERLQGYPDGWTDIGEWYDSKGKKHKDADSPRYKALGNSIALPFWQWMAERMVNVLKEDEIENPTMASLFDGIGGFPLVYSRCGCEPIWASEIEEFPIAVTKLRFKEDDE